MRYLAGRQEIQGLVGENGDHRVEECHVDMLAEAGTLALGECGLDGNDAVGSREDVGKGDAHLLRRPGGIAGEVHDAAHALDHEVIAGVAGFRA